MDGAQVSTAWMNKSWKPKPKGQPPLRPRQEIRDYEEITQWVITASPNFHKHSERRPFIITGSPEQSWWHPKHGRSRTDTRMEDGLKM